MNFGVDLWHSSPYSVTKLTNYFTVIIFLPESNLVEKVENRDEIASKGFKIYSCDYYFSILEILIRNISFGVFTCVTGTSHVD